MQTTPTKTLYVPALRTCTNNVAFYVVTLTFAELVALSSEFVFDTSGWTHTHPGVIGTILVGVRGGEPEWTPVEVNIPDTENVTEAQRNRTEGVFGMLRFSGSEVMCLLDGQEQVHEIRRMSALTDWYAEGQAATVTFVAHRHVPKRPTM